jgi:hypothetical protein
MNDLPACKPITARTGAAIMAPTVPHTVKDVPAQEFVIALAQYFRSTGKVSNTRQPPATVQISRDDARGFQPTDEARGTSVNTRCDAARATINAC